MNLIFDSEHVKVYDDVLPEEDFDILFEWFNKIPFFFPQSEGVWNEVWDANTDVLKGQPFYFPTGKIPPLDGIDKAVIPVIEKVSTVIQYGKVAMSPYYYMAGSGLKWHNDSSYKEAFTFYCHKHWSPDWGGEFMTIDLKEEDKNIVWKRFDNQELFDLIVSRGIGQFFHPKPNRLIVNSGILHKINETNKKSSARLTLQGFISNYGTPSN